MDMKNQPNKATVKDGLPTAEQILQDTIEAYNANVNDMSKFRFNKREVSLFAGMLQEFSDQQNAELREKLRIETQKAKAFGHALDIATKDELALRERVKELEAKQSALTSAMHDALSELVQCNYVKANILLYNALETTDEL